MGERTALTMGLTYISLIFYLSTLHHQLDAARVYPKPVGFWLFDDVYHGKDLSGNGNDAMLYNTEWTLGPFGTDNEVMLLTGADDQSSRVEIPNVNRALSVGQSFSWMTYFKDMETNKQGPLFSIGNVGVWGHIFWKCCGSTGNTFTARLDVSNSSSVGILTHSEDFFPQDVWTTVAVTYDQPNGIFKVFKDGVEREELRLSYNELLDDEYDVVNIGAVPSDDRELHASIFCTMYFDVSLSPEQMLAAFQQCKPRPTTTLPHPVGFWKFDLKHEGKDLSGNGNDAVLYNTVWTSDPYGMPDNAMTFTGADDQSSRTEISNINRGLSVTYSFTWLTYFKDLNSSALGPIFSIGNTGTWGVIFWKCCGAAAFHPRLDERTNGPASMSFTTANFFTQDDWIKVAVTYDYTSKAVKIYQYGEERVDLRSSFTGPLDDEWDTVYLGAHPGDGRELEASVFCTMYFDDALSRSQLEAAFSLCRPNEAQALYPWPSPVVHWPMNSYHGANNAADGLGKDGDARHYYLTDGPCGTADESFLFKSIPASYSVIDNGNNQIVVNSFTFCAWIKPNSGSGPIFRVWADESGNFQAPHIWKWPEGTQLYYAHYSAIDSSISETVQTDVGTLPTNIWSFIAVVYDYGAGNISLYINNVLEASSDIGSHETKMGPAFSLAEFEGDDQYAEDTHLACVQLFGDPLSVDEITVVQQHCKRTSQSYRPTPQWIFPFDKVRGLTSDGKGSATAVASNSISYAEGTRARTNEALLIPSNTTITLPTIANKIDGSFSLALHIRIDSTTEISLVDNVISIENSSLYIRFYDELVQFSNITFVSENSFVWFGVVYDVPQGIFSVYIDGNPVEVRYIGYHSFSISGSPNITNHGAEAIIQCYQLYTSALNLQQFVHTRDACIVYNGQSSLPYPRGFWPLNNRHRLREITGRSMDLKELNSGDVEFNETGPYGDLNDAAFLGGDNDDAVLYMLPHASLDVKFSFTVAAWIKCFSTFDDRRTNIFNWAPIQQSDYEDRGDDSQSAVRVSIGSSSEGLYVQLRADSTNIRVTQPETRGSERSFQSKYFQREEWTHIAVVLDFHGKSASLYLNGTHIQNERLNRHMLKTFYAVTVGGAVSLQSGTAAPSLLNTTKADNALACLQLYDVPLNKKQIERTMRVCKEEAQSVWFSTHPDVQQRFSNNHPNSTITTRSKLECASVCQEGTNCVAYAYRGKQCDLSTKRREELPDDQFTETGSTYVEKDKRPWKLFV